MLAPVAAVASMSPPRNLALACVACRKSSVCLPGLTPGTLAPTLPRYVAISLGLFSRSRHVIPHTSGKKRERYGTEPGLSAKSGPSTAGMLSAIMAKITGIIPCGLRRNGMWSSCPRGDWGIPGIWVSPSLVKYTMGTRRTPSVMRRDTTTDTRSPARTVAAPGRKEGSERNPLLSSPGRSPRSWDPHELRMLTAMSTLVPLPSPYVLLWVASTDMMTAPHASSTAVANW
mmetsp:Transcript_2871/g.10145  ORF Transcript_2871/g.10145 Transcript_2871/m.10145 type:complete len:230 (+) Transcript_2871:149-838(+)